MSGVIASACASVRARLRVLGLLVSKHQKKFSASISLLAALVGYSNLSKVTLVLARFNQALQGAVLEQSHTQLR